jgi:predicted DNA-binding protein
MKRFNMNLSDELHKRLKLHCVEIGKEMTEVVQRLIEEYLEKARKKPKKP